VPRKWVEPAFSVLLLGALAAASVVAHDPHRMLTRSLWRDENWVAVTLRAPLGRMASLTSTTPVLFTALIRVTPHSSPSGLRLLPLAFTAGTAIPAYLLGRQIDPASWLTRLVLAAGVATAPALLLRHDLKQYTAEAFTALLLFWLAARLERQWSRQRLIVLSAFLAAGPLLANAAEFIAPAVLAGLVAVTLVRGERSHLAELVVAGAAALVVDLAILMGIDRAGDTRSLRAYWQPFYVPTSHGFAAATHFIWARAAAELQGVGLGPPYLVIGLIVAGSITLAHTGFPGLALVVPILTVAQVGASAAQQYPLWDQRTSTWFTVLLGALSLIGVTGLAHLGWHLLRRPSNVKWLGAAIAIGIITVAARSAGPYVHADRTAIANTTPAEDVHGQVQTIQGDYRPGDVILANTDAGFGLGVYWPARPRLVSSQARLETFRVTYLTGDRVVVAATISTEAELAAVHTAVAMAAGNGDGRVWVVFSHWHDQERATMLAALRSYGTLAVPPGQHGLEQVSLLTLGAPTPGSSAPR
jgi:hypothetical protein